MEPVGFTKWLIDEGVMAKKMTEQEEELWERLHLKIGNTMEFVSKFRWFYHGGQPETPKEIEGLVDDIHQASKDFFDLHAVMNRFEELFIDRIGITK